MLYIDPRAGSDKFLDTFKDESEPMMLTGGDIAFWGEGPDGQWWIGIEHKQLEDIVGCIKSGRFTGTQLPEMMRIYDMCFLIVEGIARPDPHSGQLVRYRGKQIYGLGLRYAAFDNFLTSVNMFSALSGKPCIVKTAGTEFEAVQMIRDLYNLFQKPWHEHTAMSKPDQTKIARVPYELTLIEPKPEEDAYPQYWLRKALFQIHRLGWDVAGAVADHFGTMEKALAATTKEWEDIPRLGKTMAKRCFRALHGYDEPQPKRRKKEAVAG